jgi:quinolinate synthase
MKKTGRPMIVWDGSCVVHETFSIRAVMQLQAEFPEAELIAHPECEEPLLEQAAFIGSTSSLLRHVSQSPSSAFIVATEPGILHQMHKVSPGKKLIPVPSTSGCACNDCPYMKLNTLEKLHRCMCDRAPQIIIPHDILRRARAPIDRMLAMS